MSPPTNTINFESLPVGAISGSLTMGDVTFSSGQGLSIQNISGYTANGTEVSGNTLHPMLGGFGSGPYTPTTITFSQPVQEIGLGWFDPNLSGNVLQVFDANGTLLESAFVQNGLIGGSFAAFIGIQRSVGDIASAMIVPGATNDWYSIDNLQYVVAPVPIPAAAWLFGSALVGLIGVTRRRKS